MTNAASTPKRRRAWIWPAVLLLAACGSSSLQGCSDEAVTSPTDPSVAPSTARPPADQDVESPTTTGSTGAPVSPRPTGSANTPTQPAGHTALSLDPDPDLAAPAVTPLTASFPLDVVGQERVLVDRDGDPFLVHGDAAWSMLVQLDTDETEVYLAHRREQGFNTLLVNLIEHRFSDDPPRNSFGDDPFLAPDDFSRPNAEYFERARAALEQAADAGFLVLLAPAYLGFDGGDEGWYQQMVAAGPDRLGEYGRFVGARFGDLDNVIWVHGGDYTPPAEHVELVEAVRAGIIAAGAPQLHTAHWSPEYSATDVPVDWLDLNTTYTNWPVYVESSSDGEIDGLPHLVIESQYEDDIWDTTQQRLRAQVYEPVLTGAIGSVYGHGAIWQYEPDWREALDAPGAQYMRHGRALFDTLPWTSLVPDVRRREIIAQIGEFGSEPAIVAAATPDRSIVVAYVPDARAVEIDLGEISGSVSARWFDPTAGTFCAAESRLDDKILTVDHPGRNAADDADWVLEVRVRPERPVTP